jgi:hypothetical protein
MRPGQHCAVASRVPPSARTLLWRRVANSWRTAPLRWKMEVKCEPAASLRLRVAVGAVDHRLDQRVQRVDVIVAKRLTFYGFLLKRVEPFSTDRSCHCCSERVSPATD